MVDDLTGKKLGRASSGTFRTADVVGLDTMAHVIKTLQDNLSLETDPFYESFGTPAVLKKAAGAGPTWARRPRPVSSKGRPRRDALRAGKRRVRARRPEGRRGVRPHAEKPAAERLRLLRNAEGAPGQFLWAILRNSFHYAAVHLATPLPTTPATWTRPCAGALA